MAGHLVNNTASGDGSRDHDEDFHVIGQRVSKAEISVGNFEDEFLFKGTVGLGRTRVASINGGLGDFKGVVDVSTGRAGEGQSGAQAILGLVEAETVDEFITSDTADTVSFIVQSFRTEVDFEIITNVVIIGRSRGRILQTISVALIPGIVVERKVPVISSQLVGRDFDDTVLTVKGDDAAIGGLQTVLGFNGNTSVDIATTTRARTTADKQVQVTSRADNAAIIDGQVEDQRVASRRHSAGIIELLGGNGSVVGDIVVRLNTARGLRGTDQEERHFGSDFIVGELVGVDKGAQSTALFFRHQTDTDTKTNITRAEGTGHDPVGTVGQAASGHNKALVQAVARTIRAHVD